jgi:hypothetical protein
LPIKLTQNPKPTAKLVGAILWFAQAKLVLTHLKMKRFMIIVITNNQIVGFSYTIDMTTYTSNLPILMGGLMMSSIYCKTLILCKINLMLDSVIFFGRFVEFSF